MFKKSLNVCDTWFGFYGDFRKGTFGLPYEHGRAKWVNQFKVHATYWLGGGKVCSRLLLVFSSSHFIWAHFVLNYGRYQNWLFQNGQIKSL